MNNLKNHFSPIRYAGGKTRASKIMAQYIPEDVEKVVSPFIGGGSFEIFLNKNFGIKIEGYDIFDWLVNFWSVFTNVKDREIMLEILSNYESNKNFFVTNRKELEFIYKNNIKLNKHEKAARYFYNMQFSYGPMFLGWPSSVYLKPEVLPRKIESLRNYELKNFKIKKSDFKKVILENNEEFLYLDPPYFLEGDSKMFKGIYPNSNWAIHHKGFDHIELANLLKKHKGGFLLSYNDCPEIRELYKGFEFSFPKWHYSYSQGETRIGVNRKNMGKSDSSKDSHEILIYPKNQKKRW